jgi:hypothetical protein
MADQKGAKPPDPLGKRALYWAPPAATADGQSSGPPTVPLPTGKRALYSGASAEIDSISRTSDNPLVDRGMFTVQCQRCRQRTRVGLLDLIIFQFPIGVWIPRGRFDRRMTCPSCRKRSWCSVSLRGG